MLKCINFDLDFVIGYLSHITPNQQHTYYIRHYVRYIHYTPKLTKNNNQPVTFPRHSLDASDCFASYFYYIKVVSLASCFNIAFANDDSLKTHAFSKIDPHHPEFS